VCSPEKFTKFEMRIIVRGISLENLELWKDKFSFTEYTDTYFSKDKSFLFLTVNSQEKGLEFIQKFDNIKWKGDVLRVSESIFAPYTPCTIVIPEQTNITNPTSHSNYISHSNHNQSKYRIRNPRSRKIIKVFQNSKLKKRFRENFIQESSVRDLTWNLDVEEDWQVSSEEEEEPVNLRGLFTEITDFKFDLVEKEVDDFQEKEEEIIKSFSGSCQMFFGFEKVGVFKRDECFKEVTLEERKELTMIYKQRHKDASRRKNRYYK
jgi:hypothetical protein